MIKINNRKHHHFRVTITYGGKEEFSRIYNNREKAEKFAARQKKSLYFQGEHYCVGTRTTPIPIFLRSRSGYLRRAFSANFFVLNGCDKMTSPRPLYSKSTHRADDFIRQF